MEAAKDRMGASRKSSDDGLHWRTWCGGVREWLMRAVLKTAVLQGTVGSNPTPSAIWNEAALGRRPRLSPQVVCYGSALHVERQGDDPSKASARFRFPFTNMVTVKERLDPAN